MERRLSRKLSSEYARIARKAAFWQDKYDEWKKYGAIYPSFKLSKFITDELLQDYMDKGWSMITDIYKKKNVLGNKNDNNIVLNNDITIKFNNQSLEEQELVLGILGSIRKYMVKTIFKCVQKKISDNNLNEISFSGSENITSDFDVSIIGPNGNEIMWKMFISFLAKYSDSLPKAFDTNLYSSPIYLHKSLNHEDILCKSKKYLINRVDFDRFFLLFPNNKEDIECELSWACIKLLDNNLLIPKSLTKFINNAQKYKLSMNNLLKEINNDKIYLEISLQTNLHPANTITNETRQIIKNYYLQYLWQDKIHKYIYSDNKNQNYIKNKIILKGNRKGETNLFFYSNISNYFSSDAYYTSSTVNSIVIEDQKNLKLEFDDIDTKILYSSYLIAAIENLGDMIHHLKSSFNDIDNFNDLSESDKINNIKILIIKYSKYLFRIYRCLGKANKKEYLDKSYLIEKNVIPFRKSYNIKKADKMNIFDYLFYNNEIDINSYIKNLSNILFEDINIVFNDTINKL